MAGGIRATVVDDRMTRTVLVEAPGAQYAYQTESNLNLHRSALENLVRSTSRFATLEEWHTQLVQGKSTAIITIYLVFNEQG
jgi:hydroxymethylglutaryl-CoA reductase (NADPH)